MKKKERQKVWDKSDGHCWYCGCDLKKGWHVDSFAPNIRDAFRNGMIANPDALGKMFAADKADNLVPSCASCERVKGPMTAEQFRKWISAQVGFIRNSQSGFRLAERFGVIEIIEAPIVFWFERNENIII